MSNLTYIFVPIFFTNIFLACRTPALNPECVDDGPAPGNSFSPAITTIVVLDEGSDILFGDVATTQYLRHVNCSSLGTK